MGVGGRGVGGAVGPGKGVSVAVASAKVRPEMGLAGAVVAVRWLTVGRGACEVVVLEFLESGPTMKAPAPVKRRTIIISGKLLEKERRPLVLARLRAFFQDRF